MTNEELYLKAKNAYYSGNPIMTDSEFDELEDILIQEDSVVVRQVGGKVSGLKPKYSHISKLLSLDKIKCVDDNIPPVDEIAFWIFKKKITSIELSPKYDGNSVNIIYSKGKLKQVLSRGDGIQGNDLTSKFINKVPLTIPIKTTVEIRGEALLKKDVFLNKYTEFCNPRNLVAGILNNDNPVQKIVDDIDLIVYEIRYIDHDKYVRFEENLIQKLKEFGFKDENLPYLIHLQQFLSDKLKMMYDFWLNYRKTCIYQLDGFVIKAEFNTDRNRLGFNEHDPNWAIAVKFQPKKTITKINNINWEIGKTGEFTPVAELEPVELDGTMVSKCSLHNKRYIIDNQVYPGAEISLIKAGDIIPQVQSIITPSTQSYVFPTTCPYCKSDLEIDDIHIFCTNTECSGIKLYQYINGINVLGLNFFGQKTIEKFYNQLNLIDVFDIFDKTKFNKTMLSKLTTMSGDIYLSKLLSEIDNIKSITLIQIIRMMCIPGLGKKASIQIANMLSNIPYTSYGLPQKYFDMFHDNIILNKLYNIIDRLKKFNINVVYQEVEPVELSSFTYEMTGKPPIHIANKKDEFIQIMNTFNGKHTSLSKDTTYLVTDDITSNSSKMSKAKKLNVEIITYDDIYTKYKGK